LVLLSVLAASLLTQPVRAQSAALGQPASPSTAHARVLVMRDDDGVRGEFTQQVERVVQRSVSALGFAVIPSQLPFRDAQLAAGCAGSVRECGAPVAAALESEELLVVGVQEDVGQPHATLILLRFAPHAPTRTGTAQLPRAPAAELSATARALVESLFADRVAPPVAPVASENVSTQVPPPSVPEQSAHAAAPPPESDYLDRVARAQQRTRLLAIGWPTLTVGAGLVVGGLIANLAARRETRAYESLAPSSRDEVDVKLAHYHAAEDKAQSARILWGVGGGLAAAGVFVLLWERFGPAPDRKLHKLQAERRQGWRALRFGASPSASGFAFACAGAL
jgi:hypothetical protein